MSQPVKEIKIILSWNELSRASFGINAPGRFQVGPESSQKTPENLTVATWAGFKCDKNKIRACLLADLNSQPSNNCLAFYYLSQTMLKRRYYKILNERW